MPETESHSKYSLSTPTDTELFARYWSPFYFPGSQARPEGEPLRKRRETFALSPRFDLRSNPGYEPGYSEKRLGFLDLPGEIRNQIYRFVFVKANGPCGTREGWQTANYKGLDVRAVNPTTTFPAIGLLATCKEIHAEGTSVLYGDNAFTFLIEIFHGRQTGVKCADFPQQGVWPAKRYHKWIKRLDIAVNLWCSWRWWRGRPAIFDQQMYELRREYDMIWTYQDVGLNILSADKMTFLTSRICLQLFAPLSRVRPVRVTGTLPAEQEIYLLSRVLHPQPFPPLSFAKASQLERWRRVAHNTYTYVPADVAEHELLLRILPDFVGLPVWLLGPYEAALRQEVLRDLHTWPMSREEFVLMMMEDDWEAATAFGLRLLPFGFCVQFVRRYRAIMSLEG